MLPEGAFILGFQCEVCTKSVVNMPPLVVVDESKRGRSRPEELSVRGPAETKNGQRRADHLLRFTAPPRAREERPPVRRAAPRRRRPSVDGAFENSSIRLMVTRGVSPDVKDVDATIDWGTVCCLDTTLEECPICLERPWAPVAGPCGHVFCAGCVVHHLNMVEFSRSKRCPCCHRNLVANDLRPVSRRLPPERDDEYVLLKRNRSHRTATLFSEEQRGLPVGSECNLYSKITLAASDSVVSDVFDGILRELAVDDEYARAAAGVMLSVKEALGSVVETTKNDDDQEPSSKVFYFYGKSDGDPTFLHPLALRSLLAAVDNDPSRLPRVLQLRERYVDRFEQCAESRKRLQWLAHVQIGCEISLIDVENLGGEWEPRAKEARRADPELLAAFKARRERLRKEEEKRRKKEKRYTKQSASLLANSRLSRYEAGRREQVTFDQSDFLPLNPSTQQVETQQAVSPTNDEPSFASLVSRGFAAELGFPALGQSPESSRGVASGTTPPRQAGTWGPSLSSTRPTPKVNTTPADDEDDMFAPPPRQSTCDLGEALKDSLVVGDKPQKESSSTTGKKKKEKRRTVLSLTGGGRQY